MRKITEEEEIQMQIGNKFRSPSNLSAIEANITDETFLVPTPKEIFRKADNRYPVPEFINIG
jgi:hypothetical protein